IAGSVANFGATIGMLLAAAAGSLAETYASRWEHLWRVPFLFGGVLAFIAYLLRRHLPPEAVQEEIEAESNLEASKPEGLAARWPALQAFRDAPRTMIVGLLFTSGYGISNYLTMVFLPAFGREFAHVDAGSALRINTAGQALALLVVPLAGWLSDHW